MARNSQTTSEKPAKWTVMVYMAGDNNLCVEMVWALTEMYQCSSQGDFNLIVQLDPSACDAGTSRFVVCPRKLGGAQTGGYTPGTLRSLAIPAAPASLAGSKPVPQLQVRPLRDKRDLAEFVRRQTLRRPDFAARSDAYTGKLAQHGRYSVENSADPQVLLGFIKYCAREFAAHHYMLILSGHGSGAVGDFLSDDNGIRNNRPSSLSIPHLRWALTQAQKMKAKIDVLGLDSCLMGMAEVAYEVRNSIDFMVASEGFALSQGWPYCEVMDILTQSPQPGDLAEQLVQRYHRYYTDYDFAGVSTDISASHIENRKWKALAADIGSLAKELKNALTNRPLTGKIVLARWRAQSYKYEQYIDLWDFCDLLANDPDCVPLDEKHPLRRACQAVMTDIEGGSNPIVRICCYTGARYQHSHGVSVYFPWGEVSDQYRNLQFAKGTGWCDFLELWAAETCRDLRGWKPGAAGPPPMSVTSALASYKNATEHSAKFGGEDSAKFGGEYSGKSVAQAEEMKKWPKAFYPCDCRSRRAAQAPSAGVGSVAGKPAKAGNSRSGKKRA